MIAMVAFRGGRGYNCCWYRFGSLLCAVLVAALSGRGIGCRVLYGSGRAGNRAIYVIFLFPCYPPLSQWRMLIN